MKFTVILGNSAVIRNPSDVVLVSDLEETQEQVLERLTKAVLVNRTHRWGMAFDSYDNQVGFVSQ